MARQDNTFMWLALGGLALYFVTQQQRPRIIVPAPGTPIPVPGRRPDEFGPGATPSGSPRTEPIMMPSEGPTVYAPPLGPGEGPMVYAPPLGVPGGGRRGARPARRDD